MQRIEMNVQTGERKVIELTPEEVADALARTSAEAAQPKPPSEGMRIFNAIKADAAALGALKAELAKP